MRFLLLSLILFLPIFANGESGTFALESGRAAYQRAIKRDAKDVALRKKAELFAAQQLRDYDQSKERSLCADSEHSQEILRKLPPVRDQGFQGWCYAMVAADLASFTTRLNVSAADIAITFGRYDSPTSTLNPLTALCRHRTEIGSGGLTESAFNLSAAKGFCRESDLPTAPFASTSPSRLDKFVSELSEPHCAASSALIRSLIGSRSFSALMATATSAIKVTLKSKTSTKLAAYADKRCWRREPSYASVSSIYADGELPVTRRLAVKETLTSLGRGLPAGIGLDIAPFLKPDCNPSTLGVLMKSGLDLKKPVCDLYNELPNFDGKALHEMTAVGAKWTGKTCEIQLRNSWSGDCRCFKPDVHCTPDFISVPARRLEKVITNVDLLTNR